MEYTISKLSKLSGVSPRTLRYYEEIKLLKPARIKNNNYRVYGESEMKILQQILFYREFGLSLEEIKLIITDDKFDRTNALDKHLLALLDKRRQMDVIIKNLKKTIAAEKGEIIIMDKERFEGLKESLINENEKIHGKEIRGIYGEEIIEKTNNQFKGMSKENYKKVENLNTEILRLLEKEIGNVNPNPNSKNAQKICELHEQWLNLYWAEGMYSKEAHLSLGEMYLADERFTSYYDKAGKGSTKFLLEALKIYCK